MDKKKELFETIPVFKALMTLAVPTIISQIISMIYNLADTFFIGKTNDPYKVAASTLAFVLFFVMAALSNLFGVGGGSLISRLMGKGEEAEAKKVSSISFYGTIFVTLIYSLACLFFTEPILRMVGASDNTLPFAEDYILWVVIIGGVPATLSMALSHLLRSEGYAKFSSIGLGMGGVLNIILDPIFMFVLLPEGKEVAGAAMATALSNVISLIYFLFILAYLRGKTVLSISPRYLKEGLSYVGQILATGIPSFLGAFLASVSNMFLNQAASGHGDVELAALGIVKKIDMLPLNVGMGLCQGMLPLVAYNYASGDRKRMKEFITTCRIIGMSFAAVCIVVFQLFTPQIVRFFIEETKTVSLCIPFLRICCLATPLMIYNIQATFSLQAMGKGPESLFHSVCRQGLVNIPLLFLLNRLFGLYGVVSTQLVADSITMIISTVLLHKVMKDLKKEL
ncbi:MAG: MATE family efflux transporter [Clostridia bacterium]|nr:MATE family efflux transporter [Clostridia bacterium]